MRMLCKKRDFARQLRQGQTAVEVDGRIHDRQKDYDELRQREIESKSIKMIRIRNEELKSERVLFSRIKEAIELSAE